MKEKRDHNNCSFFPIAFGVIIIFIGAAWFLQTIGLLSGDIKVLHYVIPVCIILFGLRILTSCTARTRCMKQGIMKNYSGKCFRP